MLQEHRLERDQALDSLEDYNRMADMVEKTLAQANQAQVKLARSKEEVINLQAEVVPLRTELENAQERVTQLTEELMVAENTMEEMAQGEATPQPISSSFKRSAKFPDPPIFTEDFTEEDISSQFESWVLHIHDKLQINQDHFESQAAKTAYVLTRLSGMAMSHINSYRAGDPAYFKTADSVLSALKEIYNDPNQRENFRTSFRELKQDAKTPFPQFFSEFIRLARYLQFPDTVLIEELKDKVLPRMEKVLSESAEDFTTLTHLKNRLIRLDNQQRVYLSSRQKVNAETDSLKKTAISKSAVSQGKAKTTTVSTQETITKPAAATLKTSWKPRSNKSTAELTCFLCQEKGHISTSCPKATPKVKSEQIQVFHEGDLENK